MTIVTSVKLDVRISVIGESPFILSYPSHRTSAPRLRYLITDLANASFLPLASPSRTYTKKLRRQTAREKSALVIPSTPCVSQHHTRRYRLAWRNHPRLRVRPSFYCTERILNVKVVTANLDRIISVNYYPVPEVRRSNTGPGPVGVSVIGLADIFMAPNMPMTLWRVCGPSCALEGRPRVTSWTRWILFIMWQRQHGRFQYVHCH